MNDEKIPYLQGEKLTKYLHKHFRTGRSRHKLSPSGNYLSVFAELKTRLLAFKKLGDNKIANLIIPVGETVHAQYWIDGINLVPNLDGGQWKLRSSGAIVHSIADYKNNKYTYGRSYHYPHFIYEVHPSKILRPEKFSRKAEICESGIHFFLNLEEALDY